MLTESRGALMDAYADGGRASAPSPKPVMPPAVTCGQMANPGVPGGSGPVVKDNRNLQSASGGLQRHLPVSGGSSGSRSSGGGGSGSSGSGGSGGGSGTRNTGPSFEYSGRSSSPAKTTSNSSSAGGWGDMAKAGYGKSTGSGSSGNKSGSGSSGKTDKGGRRPIVLDLGGDGFDVRFTGTARFDMDGDGFRERVGWADAQDALLVLDLNADGTRGAGDGKIDQAKEVVLSLWGDAGGGGGKALPTVGQNPGRLDSRGWRRAFTLRLRFHPLSQLPPNAPPDRLLLWRGSSGTGKGPGSDAWERRERSGNTPVQEPCTSRSGPTASFRRLPLCHPVRSARGLGGTGNLAVKQGLTSQSDRA